MTTMPNEIATFGYVVARAVRIIGDQDDPDQYPDAVGASGSIRFTPVTVNRKSADYSTFIIFESVEGVLNEEGVLVGPSGSPGVWLVTGEYDVTFNVPGGVWGSIRILVTSEHTLETPLDLVQAVPYIPDPGVSVSTMLVPIGGSPGQVLTPTAPGSTTLEWMTPEFGDGSGKSAYQIAVDNGFVGTQAEWLASLQGEPGADALPPNFTASASTLAPGEQATANITGAYPDLTLAFGIPEGQPGAGGTGGAVDSVTVETGDEARPEASLVFWIGGTEQPVNMALGDIWFAEGTPPPTLVAPTITTTSLNSMTEGASFSQTLVASGDTPITWAVTTGTAPAGLTLSTAGVLSGTPSTAGAYSFTVTATNTAGTDTQEYTGTVAEAPIGPVGMTVFGEGAHPYAHTAYNDGSSLQLAQVFYATQAATVQGVRLWVPTVPGNSGDLTLWAFAGDVDASGNVSAVVWGETGLLAGIGQSVTIPYASIVQGWNEVALLSPFQINPVSLAANATDVFIVVGYGFANGVDYFYCPDSVMPGESAIQSADASWLYFAEGNLPGANRAANSTNGNTWTGASYGLDVRVTAV